jgi:branched-chain amino acid transport system substrate-binding protein
MIRKLAALAVTAALFSGAAFAQSTVKVVGLVELSGAGATAGTNFKNGVELAAKEINAAGGILGRKIDFVSYDTQSQPGVAKGLAKRAVDEGAYVVMGPVFSGSIIVSMAETKAAEITNFTGGEASNITAQGNPYIFRGSFNQAAGMPKLANYIGGDLKAKSVAIIFVNNDFGKGGRDAMVKELGARNIKVAADISTESNQADFSAAVLKAKQANADTLFAYLNEEESARLLRELRKQGYDKPILGETTLMGQKVIDLAGDAANGVRGHVGLTIDAPNPLVKAFADKYEREFKIKSDHNGIKGYTSMYVVKVATEKLGKFDSKALAQALHGGKFLVKDQPGLLMDVSFDEHGDLDRESYLVEVKAGKQVVTTTLPPLRK